MITFRSISGIQLARPELPPYAATRIGSAKISAAILLSENVLQWFSLLLPECLKIYAIKILGMMVK
jgi:hypothetical protein